VFNDPAIYQMRFNLVARPDLARARPDVVRRFLIALQSALASVLESPNEAKGLIAKAIREDVGLIGKIWEECDYTLTLDQGLLAGLESEARWALRKNMTARTTLPNFLDFIDAGPLQSVRPDAVSLLLP
jgi:NitT/TauT family transport system substrate-binding protein